MSGQIIEFEAKVLEVRDRGRAVLIRCEGWDKPVWIDKDKGFPMPERYQKIHVRGYEGDRYVFAREVWLIPENPAEDWPAVDKAELQKIRQTLKLDHEAWYVIVGSRYHVNPRTMEEYRRKIGAVEAEAERKPEAEKWVVATDWLANEVRRIVGEDAVRFNEKTGQWEIKETAKSIYIEKKLEEGLKRREELKAEVKPVEAAAKPEIRVVTEVPEAKPEEKPEIKPKEATEVKVETGTIQHIPLELLDPPKFRFRLEPEEELEDLVESVKALGVKEPILVRPKPDGRYELIAGERRLLAARKAGLKEIPAIVETLTDEEAEAVALTENLQRKDITPYEIARYIHHKHQQGKTQEEIAELLAKAGLKKLTRSAVANYLELYRMVEDVNRLTQNLGVRRALAYSKVSDEVKPRLLEALVENPEMGDCEFERLAQKLEEELKAEAEVKAEAEAVEKPAPIETTAEKEVPVETVPVAEKVQPVEQKAGVVEVKPEAEVKSAVEVLAEAKPEAPIEAEVSLGLREKVVRLIDPSGKVGFEDALRILLGYAEADALDRLIEEAERRLG